ncbi:MAG: primosomal replication protein N [Betaproteobacteria bacterium]|nr:primosomal replication protein N [Betaproteobacteria bacterium]MBI2960051.1 primosomal replication protein N [Betaproteobacteria bacterium]
MAADNLIVLSGRIVEADVPRRTPAGIPILKFRLAHESTQDELGTPRKVSCEIAAVAFDREARLVSAAPLGSAMTVTGFIDRKGHSSRQVILHAVHIEFETGD